MTKHNEQFKLLLVQQYLTGTKSYQSIAHEHGFQNSMLRRWVQLYQIHGLAGLSKKHTYYNAEYRLKVLQHMWDHTLSYSEVAATFNIRNVGCIGQWERCYHIGGIEALTPRSRGRPKTMPTSQDNQAPLPATEDLRSREDLQAEVDYLRMEVAYLKKLQALVQTQQQQRTIARKKRTSSPN